MSEVQGQSMADREKNDLALIQQIQTASDEELLNEIAHAAYKDIPADALTRVAYLAVMELIGRHHFTTNRRTIR